MPPQQKLHKHWLRNLFYLCVVCLVLIVQSGHWLPKQQAIQTLQQNQPGYFRVTRFKDGDTLVVDMQGTPETVRFIGVDTPETHKPNTPVQCYGSAASAHTKIIIGTSKVRLESDPLSTDRDRYGRLLRYVYLPSGLLVNEDLIMGGYGFYYPYFPYTKSEHFAEVQKTAQLASRGLWGACSPIKRGAGYVSNTAS